MNVYLALPLLAFALNGLLVYPVLRSSPRNPVNRVFSLFLISMSLWGLTVYLMRSSPDLEHALSWERTILPAFIGATLFFLHFSFLYSRIRPKRWVLPTAYLAAVAIIALVPFNLLVVEMQHKFYGYAPKVAPFFYIYLAYLYVLVITAFLNLRQCYSHAATDEERNRTGYIIAGLIASVVGGTTDFLPVVGIPVYPLGIVGNILFALLVSVAIVRQHLFDIRLVVRRGVALTLIGGVVAALYVGLFLLLNQSLAMFDLSFPIWLQIVMLVLIGMALQPFYGKVQTVVDRIFFQDRYDYLLAFERFAQETKEITDLKVISETLVRLSTLAMDAKWACLLQPFGGKLVLGASHGLSHQGDPPLVVASTSPILHWLQQQDRASVARDLQVLPQWLALPKSELDVWTSLNARVFVPLKGKKGLTAVLLLGEKNLPGPYSREDMRVLQSVANHAAIAMENAGLYEEITAQLERGRRRLEALREAAGRLALEEDPDRALQNLVDVARELLDAHRLCLAVRNPYGEVDKLFTSGLSTDQAQRLQQFIGQQQVEVSRKNGAAKSHAGAPSQEMWTAVLDGAEPATGEGTLQATFSTKSQGMGVFELNGKRGGQAFSADDERLLNLFTVLAGVLLDNVDLYDEVAQERRTLAAIQESMAEGLIVLAPSRRVLYCNKAAETLSGVQADQALGRPIEEVLSFKAADFETPQQLESLLASIGQPPEGTRGIEVTLVTPQRKELAITVFPIAGEEGQRMTGILVRDITQERDLQRRRDDFVSIASHELRTPMTTILGFSELLLSRDPPPETRREWLLFIHRDIQRLAFIVEDLLNISRIQSGRLKIDIEPLDLRQVVDGISLVRNSTGRHPVRLQIPSDLPLVAADQAKLTQVIANLLDNAIKYTPKGGPITIGAQYQVAVKQVVVSIQDRGMGIAPEDKERLFTMFHRINRPETQGIRGTGLGLYIVKELVEMMRGDIWLESELDHGTTFFFTLPALPAPAPEGQASASTAGKAPR
ncbi:MAG: GAF domain-containing protein [Chloroflexi bacterium]|nr:GAF domain-containing protein [Chloroflexota bacterium]